VREGVEGEGCTLPPVGQPAQLALTVEAPMVQADPCQTGSSARSSGDERARLTGCSGSGWRTAPAKRYLAP
jgi:hypothetical protein